MEKLKREKCKNIYSIKFVLGLWCGIRRLLWSWDTSDILV